MNDLNTLLERAAGPTSAPVDARADLTRAHRALARTRRRRGAAGLVGVAAAGVLGVGVARYALPDETGRIAIEHTDPDGPDDSADDSAAGGVRLLAQPFAAGSYTFDSTPDGWEVQGAYPAGVTIAPVGFRDQEPLSFVGKLVIMYDQNPLGPGERVDQGGRTLVVHEGEDYTTISATSLPGEPEGVVRIQFPSGTGWDRDTMLAFLAGVHVGAGARPGVG